MLGGVQATVPRPALSCCAPLSCHSRCNVRVCCRASHGSTVRAAVMSVVNFDCKGERTVSLLLWGRDILLGNPLLSWRGSRVGSGVPNGCPHLRFRSQCSSLSGASPFCVCMVCPLCRPACFYWRACLPPPGLCCAARRENKVRPLLPLPTAIAVVPCSPRPACS